MRRKGFPSARRDRSVPHRLPLTLPLRLMLASMAALAAAVAYAGYALGDAWLGRCLGGEPTLLHCPWCWGAAALAGLALAPWPRRLSGPIRTPA